ATGVVAPAAGTVTPDGTVSVGGVLSSTVTVKLPVAVLCAASVAEQLTVVTCDVAASMANCAGDWGVQTTGTFPSTLSRADTVAEKFSVTPVGPAASVT